MMQTRRQWHVALDAPTAEELAAKIEAQDRAALERGYVRRSSQHRDFGALGFAEALVYEEAPKGSEIAQRAEMLGTKPRRPSVLLPGIVIVLVAAVVVGMILTGQFDWPPPR